jgi:hypothetical protein
MVSTSLSSSHQPLSTQPSSTPTHAYIVPYAFVVVAILVSAACIVSSECRAVAITPLS